MSTAVEQIDDAIRKYNVAPGEVVFIDSMGTLIERGEISTRWDAPTWPSEEARTGRTPIPKNTAVIIANGDFTMDEITAYPQRQQDGDYISAPLAAVFVKGSVTTDMIASPVVATGDITGGIIASVVITSGNVNGTFVEPLASLEPQKPHNPNLYLPTHNSWTPEQKAAIRKACEAANAILAEPSPLNNLPWPASALTCIKPNAFKAAGR